MNQSAPVRDERAGAAKGPREKSHARVPMQKPSAATCDALHTPPPVFTPEPAKGVHDDALCCRLRRAPPPRGRQARLPRAHPRAQERRRGAAPKGRSPAHRGDHQQGQRVRQQPGLSGRAQRHGGEQPGSGHAQHDALRGSGVGDDAPPREAQGLLRQRAPRALKRESFFSQPTKGRCLSSDLPRVSAYPRRVGATPRPSPRSKTSFDAMRNRSRRRVAAPVDGRRRRRARPFTWIFKIRFPNRRPFSTFGYN